MVRLAIGTGLPVERIKTLIDERLRELLEEGFDGKISDMIRYAVSGGKRLRGILLVLTGMLLNGKPETLVDPAAALELAHSASLIHDDVIDGSTHRRGMLAFWKAYGLNMAVIVPHVMISLALNILSNYGLRVLKKAIKSWEKAALGQLMDSLVASGKDVRVNYAELAALKTGSVFEAACYIGAYLASKDLKLAESLGKYGLNLGIAYQVLDDLAGISDGDEDSGTLVLLRKLEGGESIARRLLKESVESAISNVKRLKTPEPFVELMRTILTGFAVRSGLDGSLLPW